MPFLNLRYYIRITYFRHDIEAWSISSFNSSPYQILCSLSPFLMFCVTTLKWFTTLAQRIPQSICEVSNVVKRPLFWQRLEIRFSLAKLWFFSFGHPSLFYLFLTDYFFSYSVLLQFYYIRAKLFCWTQMCILCCSIYFQRRS